MYTIAIIIEVIALCLIIVSGHNKNGYAIRCIIDGIFLGLAAAHLVPGSALYYGTTSDLAFSAVSAVVFAYSTWFNYKHWKNKK